MHCFIQISQLLVLLAIYLMDLYLLCRYDSFALTKLSSDAHTSVLHSLKHELGLVFI